MCVFDHLKTNSDQYMYAFYFYTGLVIVFRGGIIEISELVFVFLGYLTEYFPNYIRSSGIACKGETKK